MLKFLKLLLIASIGGAIMLLGTLQVEKEMWKNKANSDKPQIDFVRELYGDPGPLGESRAQLAPDPLRDRVKALLNDKEDENKGSAVSEWGRWLKSKIVGTPKQ